MKKSLYFLIFALITAFAPLSAQNGVDNGHKYVDLGLPSGTKWADCNVGASFSTESGNFYAWGEIKTKSDYSWRTYKYALIKHSRVFSYKITKYCTISRYGNTDNKKELDLSDDVARQLWGGKWRMPSKEQFAELLNNTTNEWAIVNGVKGRVFTAKNGNSIFLPATGIRNGMSLASEGSGAYYWSRTLCTDGSGIAYGPDHAHFLFINKDRGDVGCHVAKNHRYLGGAVRPVHP